jgi:hypothetical protein
MIMLTARPMLGLAVTSGSEVVQCIYGSTRGSTRGGTNDEHDNNKNK